MKSVCIFHAWQEIEDQEFDWLTKDFVENGHSNGVSACGCVFLLVQVTRVTSRFCKSLILAVNDVLLKEPFHGLLRYVLTMPITWL